MWILYCQLEPVEIQKATKFYFISLVKYYISACLTSVYLMPLKKNVTMKLRVRTCRKLGQVFQLTPSSTLMLLIISKFSIELSNILNYL